MTGEVVQAAGKSMDELIDADGFEAVTAATKSVCGYDRDNLNAHTGLPTYKTPSKAMKKPVRVPCAQEGNLGVVLTAPCPTKLTWPSSVADARAS